MATRRAKGSRPKAAVKIEKPESAKKRGPGRPKQPAVLMKRGRAVGSTEPRSTDPSQLPLVGIYDEQTMRLLPDNQGGGFVRAIPVAHVDGTPFGDKPSSLVDATEAWIEIAQLEDTGRTTIDAAIKAAVEEGLLSRGDSVMVARIHSTISLAPPPVEKTFVLVRR